MMEGMKMATQGMMAMQEMQEVIANNLANVGTAGFRKDVMDVSTFSQVMERQMNRVGSFQIPGHHSNDEFMQVSGGMDTRGMLYTSSRTSYSQGALKMTGNQFDFALDDNGKGFFTVQSKEGIKFTRNGSFRLSTDGYLVTQDGSKLLGQKGPIKVGGNDLKVDDNGKILVDNKEIDRLLITEFNDNGNLQKSGDNNFMAKDGFKISNDFRVKQGYLEMANVNAVREMVDMMQMMKTYEANAKVLQAQDQALRKSANEVGKIG